MANEVPQQNGTSSPLPGGLRGPRLWLVHVLIGVLAGGSLGAIVVDTECWPFSPYAMYSDLRRERSLTWLRLFGVLEGGEAREIPLLASAYLLPFDKARLPMALARMHPHPNNPAVRAAVRDCLLRYEARRRAGHHQGPPLRGVRLYRLTWQLDPWAGNADSPDRKELLMEVLETGKEGP